MSGIWKKIITGLGLAPKEDKAAPLRKGEIEVVRMGKSVLFVTNSRGERFSIPRAEQRCRLFYLERTDTHYLFLSALTGDRKAKTVKISVRNLETFKSEVIEVTSSFINSLET